MTIHVMEGPAGIKFRDLMVLLRDNKAVAVRYDNVNARGQLHAVPARAVWEARF